MDTSCPQAVALGWRRLAGYANRRRRRLAVLPVALAVLALGAPAGGVAAMTSTQLTITGANVVINGQLTHLGTASQGLLTNSRMINGIFDDANPATRSRWAYPDSGVWDANRNTDELIAMLPTYRADGLDAITVGMQGGLPVTDRSIPQTWSVSGFNPDGSLNPDWMSRLDRLVTAAGANHMVVILNLFYMAQDQRITSDAGISKACVNVTNWLTTGGPHAPYTNVMIDVANEINNTGTTALTGFDHANLTSRGVPALLDLIRTTSKGTIPVGTGYMRNATPSNTVVAHSDIVLLHGNGLSASTLAQHIATVKATSAYIAHPKPIIVNEDNSSGLTNMTTAIAKHSGWGFYEEGSGTYSDGFQAVPINWSINDSAKQSFFTKLRSVS